MDASRKKHYLLYICLSLFVSSVYLVWVDWQSSHKQFAFSMLDVGQGDALFVESPTGTQVLIDGGPPKKILGKLNQVMSPFDKSIDAIIITNPDADHIGGLQDVLKNYKVGMVLEPGTISSSKTYQNLEMEIKNKKIKDVLARRGMRLDLGGGAMINILFPDRDVSNWKTNDGSVVAKLIYKNTSIMLTGDAPKSTETIILNENSLKNLQSGILKVGHHGSRGSTSAEFVQTVSPKYALISVGKDNKYGHPHSETLDTFIKFGTKIFRTDLLGTIILKFDGQKETLKFLK